MEITKDVAQYTWLREQSKCRAGFIPPILLKAARRDKSRPTMGFELA
jgi:hypothetical protein